jgi:hypothetical protein
VIHIAACARDLNLNWGQDGRFFGVLGLIAGSGGLARSADGRLEVALPGGSVTSDMYVVILDAPAVIDGLTSVYEVSPPSHELRAPATVSLAYDHGMSDPERLCIARIDGGTAKPIESYLDRGRNRVIAYIDRFGTYGLLWDENVSSSDYGSGELRLLQNTPNPFQATTSISYELPRPTWLRLDVISVEGRHVTRLWEGVATPGVHEIVWDGTDENGRRVASGVYHYVVTSDAGSATRKMVLLH